MVKIYIIYTIVIIQAYLAGYCYIEKEYFASGFVGFVGILTFLIGKAARGAMR